MVGNAVNNIAQMSVNLLRVGAVFGLQVPNRFAAIVAIVEHHKRSRVKHFATFGHQELHQLVVGKLSFEVHACGHQRGNLIIAS